MEAWNCRSLSGRAYPFVIVDALVLRVRKDGSVRQMSTFIAVGAHEEGHLEILGMILGNSESVESWSTFFSWLKDRGLTGVDWVVSDDHRGLVAAVRRHFQEAVWQRCQTHYAESGIMPRLWRQGAPLAEIEFLASA